LLFKKSNGKKNPLFKESHRLFILCYRVEFSRDNFLMVNYNYRDYKDDFE